MINTLIKRKQVINISYRFVEKEEYSFIKNELIDLIHLVQDEVREYFTFRYDFVGSSKYNMITTNDKSNIGFDFDLDIRVNDDEENYTAEEIRNILKEAFNKIINQGFTNFDYPENSTRVLTIKVKDQWNSKILYSADIAVVFDCEDGRQQYIHFNKKQNSYYWNYKRKSFYELEEKINSIKECNYV
ncbi:MAG: hypothetical protein K2J98_01185, partial [Malacoplasma sp.]|nr:hypothetical protein [Malacoplasma sp.]